MESVHGGGGGGGKDKAPSFVSSSLVTRLRSSASSEPCSCMSLVCCSTNSNILPKLRQRSSSLELSDTGAVAITCGELVSPCSLERARLLAIAKADWSTSTKAEAGGFLGWRFGEVPKEGDAGAAVAVAAAAAAAAAVVR
eukprot:6492457-Amphidinium_carterae.2